MGINGIGAVHIRIISRGVFDCTCNSSYHSKVFGKIYLQINLVLLGGVTLNYQFVSKAGFE